MIDNQKPKFALGQVVATPNALDALGESGESPVKFLNRHVYGDWGDLEDEDKQANEDAISYGGRLLSKYHTKLGVAIWIITEADRSSTCVLLPENY